VPKAKIILAASTSVNCGRFTSVFLG